MLRGHITDHDLAPEDLLFTPTLLLTTAEPSHLQLVSEPVDLGLTPANGAGRQYRHGTLTGYKQRRVHRSRCADNVIPHAA